MTRAFFAVVVLLLASCASPTPDLYTLEAVPGPVRQGPARVVVLREIGVAKYLDRPQIVRSSDANRVVFEPNARWAEPLSAMITGVIAENLEQRMPGTTVLRESGAVSGPSDILMEVDVRRLDGEADGAVVLEALHARRGGRQQAERLSVAPAGAATIDQVRAMDAALGRLCDSMAATLR